MCFHPLHILNRSRRFRSGIDLPVLSVPCGHCEQCQSQKMDDWFVRASAEYDRVVKSGGFVWFPTLTYDKEHLPIWKDDDNKFICPVFNKKHFVSFRNKLRVYLKRHGFVFKGVDTIRYFYCCEYGGKNGRPHLHCLLFVPRFVPFNLFKELVQKSWSYGMVRYSPSGYSINSVKGIKYSMKYLHKDCLYYDKYGIDNYIAVLRNAIHSSDLELSNISNKKYRMFKRCLPHHCQSMGFGSSLVLSDDDFIKDRIKASQLGLYDMKFEYRIPIYYKRKFLYDFDKVLNIYSINERGKHIKQASFDNLLKSLERYYKSALCSGVVTSYVENVSKDLKNNPLYDYYKKLSNYSFRDIAIFSLIYNGLSIYKTQYLSMCNDNNLLSKLADDAYFYWCARVDNVEVSACSDYKANGALRDSRCYGFEDLPQYHDMRKGLDFLYLFECEFGEYQNEANLKMYYRQSIQFGKLFNLV